MLQDSNWLPNVYRRIQHVKDIIEKAKAAGQITTNAEGKAIFVEPLDGAPIAEELEAAWIDLQSLSAPFSPYKNAMSVSVLVDPIFAGDEVGRNSVLQAVTGDESKLDKAFQEDLQRNHVEIPKFFGLGTVAEQPQTEGGETKSISPDEQAKRLKTSKVGRRIDVSGVIAQDPDWEQVVDKFIQKTKDIIARAEADGKITVDADGQAKFVEPLDGTPIAEELEKAWIDLQGLSGHFSPYKSAVSVSALVNPVFAGDADGRSKVLKAVRGGYLDRAFLEGHNHVSMSERTSFLSLLVASEMSKEAERLQVMGQDLSGNIGFVADSPDADSQDVKEVHEEALKYCELVEQVASDHFELLKKMEGQMEDDPDPLLQVDAVAPLGRALERTAKEAKEAKESLESGSVDLEALQSRIDNITRALDYYANQSGKIFTNHKWDKFLSIFSFTRFGKAASERLQSYESVKETLSELNRSNWRSRARESLQKVKEDVIAAENIIDNESFRTPMSR